MTVGLVEGHVILVTGAASGIGRAAASVLAREGALLVLADIDEEGGEATLETVREHGAEARFLPCDVRRPPQVKATVLETLSTFDRLDGAFNDAGVLGPLTPLVDLEEPDFDQVVATNLRGTWLCMRAQLDEMLDQGEGAIVNAASTAGMRGFPNAAAYAATKHAILGLTRSAALEVAEEGVRVNAVCPGITRTPMVERSVEEGSFSTEDLLEETTAGRMAEPEEVGEAVGWLLSDRASHVNGHALTVDGGTSVG